MPNGGTHHCFGCSHFVREEGLCGLRQTIIEHTHHTTCPNHHGGLFGTPTPSTEPTGPLHTIVCEVIEGRGSYWTIPFFEGRAPDLVRKLDGSPNTFVRIAESEGEAREFERIEQYLEWLAERVELGVIPGL